MGEKLRTVTLEELSISDILLIFEAQSHSFCADRREYLKYGTDLRACWEKLYSNDNHYDTVCDILDLSDDDVPEELLKHFMKFMKPTVKRDEVKAEIQGTIPSGWWKEAPDTDDNKERQWLIFRAELFNYLESALIQHSEFGMKLIQSKTKKKK